MITIKDTAETKNGNVLILGAAGSGHGEEYIMPEMVRKMNILIERDKKKKGGLK